MGDQIIGSFGESTLADFGVCYQSSRGLGHWQNLNRSACGTINFICGNHWSAFTFKDCRGRYIYMSEMSFALNGFLFILNAPSHRPVSLVLIQNPCDQSASSS